MTEYWLNTVEHELVNCESEEELIKKLKEEIKNNDYEHFELNIKAWNE